MTYVGDGEISAVLARADARQTVGLGPLRAAVVVSADRSGGRYSLYDLHLGPDARAGPHFHRTFAESFHVLAGSVELYDGRTWTTNGPDDHLLVPEGGIHAFRNPGPQPARMLMMSTPGVRREAYFRELVEVVRAGHEMSAQEWTELFARHDQYMV